MYRLVFSQISIKVPGFKVDSSYSCTLMSQQGCPIRNQNYAAKLGTDTKCKTMDDEWVATIIYKKNAKGQRLYDVWIFPLVKCNICVH